MTDKFYNVGSTQRLTPEGTEMSILKQSENALEMMERSDAAAQDLSMTELKLDGSNLVRFPDFPYMFEALYEKLLVSIDISKTGYECKVCLGKKRIQHKCECEVEGHPGTKYSAEQIETIKSSFGEELALARAEMECPECHRDYVSMRTNEICSACKGLGATIFIPDTSKRLPTTGVVVSIGEGVNLSKIRYKVGDRILFGAYAGDYIPTKSGLMLKIIDHTQAWCRIDGASDLGSFDFILAEKE
jgi:co-chaperonin GroES (HSP10)